MADEKQLVKKGQQLNLQLTKKNSELTIALNKLDIEHEHFLNQFNDLKKEYDILKSESNISTYQTKHSISLADDYRTKLESIKQKQHKHNQKSTKEHLEIIEKFNNKIEN